MVAIAEPSLAARREASRLGIAIAAMMPMIATTIRSSINEKPSWRLVVIRVWCSLKDIGGFHRFSRHRLSVPCLSRAEREVSICALTTGVPLEVSAQTAKKRSFLIEILLVDGGPLRGRRDADKIWQRANDALWQHCLNQCFKHGFSSRRRRRRIRPCLLHGGAWEDRRSGGAGASLDHDARHAFVRS